ncbi:hypothetical protein WJX77_008118 [Trebouxia sp. C0004]
MRFTISTARYRVITWSASLGITLSGLTDEGADERQDTGRSLRSTVAGYARRYYGPERLVAADARARVAENAGAGTNADRPAPAQPAAARRTGTMREVAATSAQVTASSSGLHTSTGLADSPAPSLQPSTYLSTLLNASLSPITHSAYANLRAAPNACLHSDALDAAPINKGKTMRMRCCSSNSSMILNCNQQDRLGLPGQDPELHIGSSQQEEIAEAPSSPQHAANDRQYMRDHQAETHQARRAQVQALPPPSMPIVVVSRPSAILPPAESWSQHPFAPVWAPMHPGG